MPDIFMCRHPTCPSRRSCYRHSASGTQPSDFRQAWMVFQPEPLGVCDYYLPVRGKEQGEADD